MIHQIIFAPPHRLKRIGPIRDPKVPLDVWVAANPRNKRTSFGAKYWQVETVPDNPPRNDTATAAPNLLQQMRQIGFDSRRAARNMAWPASLGANPVPSAAFTNNCCPNSSFQVLDWTVNFAGNGLVAKNYRLLRGAMNHIRSTSQERDRETSPLRLESLQLRTPVFVFFSIHSRSLSYSVSFKHIHYSDLVNIYIKPILFSLY